MGVLSWNSNRENRKNSLHSFRIPSKNENAGSRAGVSGGEINGFRVSLPSFQTTLAIPFVHRPRFCLAVLHLPCLRRSPASFPYPAMFPEVWSLGAFSSRHLNPMCLYPSRQSQVWSFVGRFPEVCSKGLDFSSWSASFLCPLRYSIFRFLRLFLPLGFPDRCSKGLAFSDGLDAPSL